MNTRRNFLQASLSLPVFLAGSRLARSAEPESARARSVILLWMWGGPSHLDTFDPKPDAPAEIRGPFSTTATQTPGLRFSELFPQLATRSSMFSVARSHINYDTAHHIAGSIALTGRKGRNGDNNYDPNFGSIVQRAKTAPRPAQSDDRPPPFIAIGAGPLNTAAGGPKGYGGGAWGPAFDPFPVRCTELDGVQLPALKLLPGLRQKRLSDRRRLLQQYQTAGEQPATPRARWSDQSRNAYQLLTSKAGRAAFDLSAEKEKTRRRFGKTQFGQSCLLARRLVEAGATYIQVNWSQWVENIYDARTDFGWDTHWLNFEHLADRHGPIFDRAAAALLDDLSERGLLDSTLVVAMGEFGRTPKISDNGGRDHWSRCYSSLWAGGGVAPGRVIGQSDRRGYDPVTEPIPPDAVGVTMLELLGVHSAQRAQLRVLPDAKPIAGLLE